jgi:hypothetical protein
VLGHLPKDEHDQVIITDLAGIVTVKARNSSDRTTHVRTSHRFSVKRRQGRLTQSRTQMHSVCSAALLGQPIAEWQCASKPTAAWD